MGLRGIALYTLRAATFAAAVSALAWLICRLRGKRLRAERLLGIAYLAALFQITVLRGGIDWHAVFAGGRAMPQLLPLKTTFDEARRGLWPLIYHALGNMLWFFPMGVLLRRKKAWLALATGACASACIELMQLLLMTGATDIDDVLFNALGALLGWLAARKIQIRH